MFLGTYEYKIDEKGRTPLPPRFRDDLRQGMVMTQGLEKCITVYSLDEWQNISDKLAGHSVNRSKARRISRFTFATAFMAELDAQGRAFAADPDFSLNDKEIGHPIWGPVYRRVAAAQAQ